MENSRLHHATQLTELHRNFISASRDVEAVRYAIERLAEQFLDLPQRRQPLAQQMQVLEQCVSNHQHLFMPNNTLDQNLATLLAIAGLGGGAQGGRGGAPPAPRAAAPADEPSGPASSEAIRAATISVRFRALSNDINALDLTCADDRFRAVKARL